MKSLFTLLFSFITLVSFSQNNFGHLSIFSEDGDKFQLYLNGELINDEPQANLRVEDLNQPYYNARIVFEDPARAEIKKNNLMIADADGIFTDVTYKIKRDKNMSTKMKLNYFSSVAVQPNFIPASNVHVVHYGQPRPRRNEPGVNMGVNMGGVNIDVSIQDPNMQVTTHEQTTYSETRSHQQAPAPRGCRNRFAMSSTDFNNAMNTMKGQSFDDTRLKVAKQVASANCLSVQQIKQLASQLSFEEGKLDFAKFAYDYCIDTKNYFNLNDMFSFSSSVDELTNYISTKN